MSGNIVLDQIRLQCGVTLVEIHDFIFFILTESLFAFVIAPWAVFMNATQPELDKSARVPQDHSNGRS